jgi:hypothetical protein
MEHNVPDTEATIIDFEEYRSLRKQQQTRRNTVGPRQFVRSIAAVPLLWFWPVFVWVPVFTQVADTAESEF